MNQKLKELVEGSKDIEIRVANSIDEAYPMRHGERKVRGFLTTVSKGWDIAYKMNFIYYLNFPHNIDGVYVSLLNFFGKQLKCQDEIEISLHDVLSKKKEIIEIAKIYVKNESFLEGEMYARDILTTYVLDKFNSRVEDDKIYLNITNKDLRIKKGGIYDIIQDNNKTFEKIKTLLSIPQS
jgi:hypothetical protein